MDPDSHEVHSDDNKALPEKGKKRKLKTPSQVEALEKFYSEHKYPSEKMKSQLAESIGLTEKQVSGWFCHRRLKDKKSLYGEASANGRQDRSSGIVQDLGSGHRQDSCGSTKQGDNKHFDLREVESKRFSVQDAAAADLAYEHGHHHDGHYSDMDDTSSGSSLPLQHRFNPQNEDSSGIAAWRYLPPKENIAPVNTEIIRTRTGPSGYLKVKGKIESPAITAVKRQLGRYYCEDGPPLGVEFDPLPPGAFESSIRDQVNESYYHGGQELHDSPDVPRIHKQPNSSMRYEAYNSKMSSQDSDMDGTSFKIMQGSDHHENSFGQESKLMPLLPNHGNRFPGHNTSVELDEGSVGEMPVIDSRRLYKMRAKHGFEARKMDPISSHHLHPYGRTESRMLKSADGSPKDSQRELFESQYSNMTAKYGESFDMEDKRLPRKIGKIPKGDQYELSQKQISRKAQMEETAPWTNRIKRSAVDIPSSFSEDETADTSSSVD
ncbi:hypothetical protein NMG60_11033635 [Bertholletia excelsa]